MGIYLNWFSHEPNTWERGALKVLINRACTLCSTDYHLKEELRYLEKIFVYISTMVSKTNHEKGS